MPLDTATDVTINYDGDDALINFEWPAADEGFEVENYTFNLGTSVGSQTLDLWHLLIML